MEQFISILLLTILVSICIMLFLWLYVTYSSKTSRSRYKKQTKNLLNNQLYVMSERMKHRVGKFYDLALLRIFVITFPVSWMLCMFLAICMQFVFRILPDLMEIVYPYLTEKNIMILYLLVYFLTLYHGIKNHQENFFKVNHVFRISFQKWFWKKYLVQKK